MDDAELLIRRVPSTQREHAAVADSVPEAVIIAATLGPFVTAVATKLGERIGTTLPIERATRRWRGRQRDELVVGLRRAHAGITVELDSATTDDARLALIELDVRRPELWGHRLRWDETVQAWLPVPDISGREGAERSRGM
ncbi:hypothetical protein G3I60_41200 [Streptomyces sp. SID13666]|uniref:hypothetical protein n=1 Tax=unclassified Streptomyces TaxID=2593676 RepID=UPI0013BF9131|nr:MULTISPECIES: hypothetical protein [unclassified Streptomyces]NEA60413.1 hypothetical protein [Streptomyces sp. SID13666]NEA76845.1 hypothetical protein [Streptomyces sp. SID13588]